MPRYARLADYECSHHAPYYPIAYEDGGQVYYASNLLDPAAGDPMVYRLDSHGWSDHQPAPAPASRSRSSSRS